MQAPQSQRQNSLAIPVNMFRLTAMRLSMRVERQLPAMAIVAAR